MSEFSVLPYDLDSLIRCFVGGSGFTSEKEAREKSHSRYFKEYFEKLRAATIVTEPEYIDKDYLEDYAAYYDRCFRDYKRRTLRLHFFSQAFDKEEFERTLTTLQKTDKKLCESYLGFIVVKPLPQKIIGRTCLKTYPEEERRNFPILRDYPINLFGLELTVRSLAYQEQDTVVAACATSALWSCFQGTGVLFQHKIPPPVEITEWAGSHLPENLLASSSRTFPNSGLTATQMAYAVRRVGLDPLVIGANSRYALNSVMYAYLRGKIPSILALGLDRQSHTGGHAVAVTGYSLGYKDPVPEKNGFLLRANRIDRIYAHDDQVGPFARMIWRWRDEDGKHILETSWDSEYVVTPRFLLFPLYHKIRIPFSLLEQAIIALDTRLERVRKIVSGVNRAEWDIYLTTANDYKTSVRADYRDWGEKTLLRSLTVDLPRFIWRVMMRVDNELQFDFLFDATGIAQHDLLVHMATTEKEEDYGLIFSLTNLVSESVGHSKLPRQAKAILGCFTKSPSLPH